MPPVEEGPPATGGRLRWAAGLGLLASGIVALAVWAVASPGALAYYKTPTDLAIKEPPPGATVRVGGRVRDLERAGNRVTFVLADARHSVTVSYLGEIPDTLKDGTDGIAEGHVAGPGHLQATRVQAKCSSKYVPKDRSEELGK